MTWIDARNGDQDIYAQRYAAAGTLMGPNFKVNDDEMKAEQYSPVSAADSNGNFVIYLIPLQSHVLLRVYDVQGREVTTLVNGVEQPGNTSVILNAEGWSSGIYYYCLQAGEFVQTKKLILLQ